MAETKLPSGWATGPVCAAFVGNATWVNDAPWFVERQSPKFVPTRTVPVVGFTVMAFVPYPCVFCVGRENDAPPSCDTYTPVPTASSLRVFTETPVPT